MGVTHGCHVHTSTLVDLSPGIGPIDNCVNVYVAPISKRALSTELRDIKNYVEMFRSQLPDDVFQFSPPVLPLTDSPV